MFYYAHVANHFVRASKEIIRSKVRPCYILPRATHRKAKTILGDSTHAALPEPSGAAKKLRTETSSAATSMQRYARLHSLLWKKEELRDVVFVKKTVSVLEFAEGKPCSITVVEHDMLSLDGAIDKYLGNKPSEHRVDWERLLPCGSNSLVFREAYRELLDWVVADGNLTATPQGTRPR